MGASPFYPQDALPHACWERFSEEYLAKFGLTRETSGTAWIEYRSTRTLTLLPAYRLFSPTAWPWPSRMSHLFAVTESGAITDLGDGSVTFSGIPGITGPWNPKLQKFLISAGLTIRSESDAAEVTALVEELIAACHERKLQIAGWEKPCGDNFVYDARLDGEVFQRAQDWKFVAKRSGPTWTTTRRYIGPPASTRLPYVWQLGTDGSGRLTSFEFGDWDPEE